MPSTSDSIWRLTWSTHLSITETLTIHADRGAPMTATSTALMLASPGIGKSHSRPHQSNDNPFSESQFKTMKYHPTFPERFGSILDARAICLRFFQWYNHEHRHAPMRFRGCRVHFNRVI